MPGLRLLPRCGNYDRSAARGHQSGGPTIGDLLRRLLSGRPVGGRAGAFVGADAAPSAIGTRFFDAAGQPYLPSAHLALKGAHLQHNAPSRSRRPRFRLRIFARLPEHAVFGSVFGDFAGNRLSSISSSFRRNRNGSSPAALFALPHATKAGARALQRTSSAFSKLCGG